MDNLLQFLQQPLLNQRRRLFVPALHNAGKIRQRRPGRQPLRQFIVKFFPVNPFLGLLRGLQRPQPEQRKPAPRLFRLQRQPPGQPLDRLIARQRKTDFAAAAAYRGRQFRQAPANQDDDAPIRRLFQRLQKAVGGGVIHAVGPRDKSDPVLAVMPVQREKVGQFADLRDLDFFLLGDNRKIVRMILRGQQTAPLAAAAGPVFFTLAQQTMAESGTKFFHSAAVLPAQQQGVGHAPRRQHPQPVVPLRALPWIDRVTHRQSPASV